MRLESAAPHKSYDNLNHMMFICDCGRTIEQLIASDSRIRPSVGQIAFKMDSGDQYRWFAAECMKMAELTQNEDHKNMLTEMAESSTLPAKVHPEQEGGGGPWISFDPRQQWRARIMRKERFGSLKPTSDVVSEEAQSSARPSR
jgi:hypothetical protein